MSPKTSCTIHTNHSLFVLFLFLFFFFFCGCPVLMKKKERKKRFIILEFVFSLQQTTFRAPFSKERSRRHWVSVWCKTACFGWNTLPPLCSGTVPPRDWPGDGVCFIRFSLCFLFSISSPSAAFVGHPALDVPLHVKSQMVGPGETSVDPRNIW